MQRSWSIQSKSVPRLAPLSSAATLLRGLGQSAARDPFGRTALKRADADPDLLHGVALADHHGVFVERVKLSPRNTGAVQIADPVGAFSDILTVLRNASEADKAEVYGRLGLRLVYQPEHGTVRAEAWLST